MGGDEGHENVEFRAVKTINDFGRKEKGGEEG